MKDIYTIELHESIKLSDKVAITRVPGGWIYSGTRTATFVPFSDEFSPDKLKG